MPIALSGSLAYDYIMDFPDSFKNHILPEQIHILSVSFVVDTLKKNLGGTAGNIGYTTKLLGADPIILGSLGSDAGEYMDWFKKHGIRMDHISISKKLLTASAYITTDKDDNQINAFYPGALGEDAALSIHNIKEAVDLAIISPTKKEAMIKHAKECFEKEIPFVFDPGQQITALSPQELMTAIGQAAFLIGNDYEMKLIEEKTGWDEDELFSHVETVITTLGEKGSVIKTKKETLEIAPCPPQSVEDPTGAGDAYRAGFFGLYIKGKDMKTCGQAGSVAASYAIEHYGTQKHVFTMESFEERYKRAYAEEVRLG
jgi:adenosine kinase